MDLKQIFNLLRFVVVIGAIVAIGVAYLTCCQLKANMIGFHEPFDIHDSFHYYEREAEIKAELARERLHKAIDAKEEEKRIQAIKDSEVKPTLKEMVEKHCDNENQKKERRKIDKQIREIEGHSRDRGTYSRVDEREVSSRESNTQRERDRDPLGKN